MTEFRAALPEGAPVVLVIEDDSTLSLVLQTMLESSGYAVQYAHDGLTGLARIQAGGIDLVLLDLRLPGLSGLELCRAVRAAAPADDIYLPIIIVTGLNSEEERAAVFAAGADDYVPKPFHMSELLARVGVWMRVRRHAYAARAARDALRESERRQLTAQLETVTLVARELGHLLNNELAAAVGLLEFLEEHPPDNLPDWAVLHDAVTGLGEAVRHISQLQQVVRVATKETPVGPSLDLERSVEPERG